MSYVEERQKVLVDTGPRYLEHVYIVEILRIHSC